MAEEAYLDNPKLLQSVSKLDFRSPKGVKIIFCEDSLNLLFREEVWQRTTLKRLKPGIKGSQSLKLTPILAVDKSRINLDTNLPKKRPAP